MFYADRSSNTKSIPWFPGQTDRVTNVQLVQSGRWGDKRPLADWTHWRYVARRCLDEMVDWYSSTFASLVSWEKQSDGGRTSCALALGSIDGRGEGSQPRTRAEIGHRENVPSIYRPDSDSGFSTTIADQRSGELFRERTSNAGQHAANHF